MRDFLGLDGMTRGRMFERAVFHGALFAWSGGWWPFAFCCVMAVLAGVFFEQPAARKRA